MKTKLKEFFQNRKALFLLPLLMLPFIILLGWSLGIGKGQSDATPTTDQQGLSTMLPEPAFDKKQPWDKLSLYELAQQDSERFEEARKNDPYYELVTVNTPPSNDLLAANDSTGLLLARFPRKEARIQDPIEQDVNEKLEQLYARLNQTPTAAQEVRLPDNLATLSSDPQFTSDVDRLERVMESLQDASQPNPEMQQIESVLNKILDIQHPERITNNSVTSMLKSEQNELVTKLEKRTQDDIISFVSTIEEIDSLSPDSVSLPIEFTIETTGFFGLESDMPATHATVADIEAVIHDTQKVTEGSIVKLRLLTEAKVNDQLLAAGQFIYGIVSFNNERLKININSIRHDISIMQVALKVFDLDGMEGISIPGSRNQADSKSMAGNSLQNVQLLSMNPTLEAQAASAGVEAVKSLFGKRIKSTSVTLKAGYQVLLKAATPAMI